MDILFSSQSGEDRFLYETFFKGKKNGKYIELGAMDGLMYSNTYFFEKNFSWSGVLIEPNDFNFKKLETNRPKNFLFQDLVSNKTNPLIFRYFEDAMSAVSGVESSLSQHHLELYFDTNVFCKEQIHEKSNSKCSCWWASKQPQSRKEIQPKTLTEILKTTNIKKFDFLSLDVEGHEFEVLESWDFSIPIDVILIEMLGVQKEKDQSCRQILSNNNYVFYSPCAHNEVWVHRDFVVPKSLKIMRIGYTEGTLLLLWYMKELCSHKDYHSFLNWLLSTSGYYDNNIKGSYFNFEADECLKIINSDVFNSYMKQLYLGLFHCDKLLICSHGICSTLLTQDVKPSDSSSLNIMDIHNLISNKKVLIMSSFAILIEQQVLSGNCRAIYENFPENVIIIPFQTEYTFFNKGNDNNILETFERYKETIKDIDFDLAIVSCGAYTHLLVPYISDVLHKDAITSFACVITDTFGIKTKRFEHKKIYDEKTKKFWLEIPEQYRPKDYLKIENGCYW